MTDYRTLPDDAKREIVYAALKYTKACQALSAIAGDSVEVWGERISMSAYQEMQQLGKADIDNMVEVYEEARRNQYGATLREIKVSGTEGFKPKGEQTQDEG